MELQIPHQNGYQVPVSIHLVSPSASRMQKDVRQSFRFDWVKHIRNPRYDVYGMYRETGELIGLMALHVREKTYHVEYMAKRGKYTTNDEPVPVQIAEGFMHFAATQAYDADPESPALVIVPKGGTDLLFDYYGAVLEKAMAPKRSAIADLEAQGYTIYTYHRGTQGIVQEEMGVNVFRDVIHVYATGVFALIHLY